MSKQRLTNITQNERQNKGVVALADRPNVVSTYGKGGLSPLELKVWFDKLGNLMADKINEIQNALNDSGQDYIGIDNLGDTIECLGDLTATFLNGSFATLLLAYHSAADSGDEDNLATLQAIINEKARLIAELDEAFTDYKALIKSNAGAAEVGIADAYNGSGNKLSNLVADIASGVLATKITFECYGFATANKSTATSVSLKTFIDNVADALQGDISCGLLEKINDRYTKAETDAMLALKTDKSTYNTEQGAQDSRLTSLETRATTVEGDIGNMANVTPIAADVALAIKSLNEDIDSLQLGVIPRIIRGVVLWATPETLDASLIAELNAKVLSATGRNQANNSDSVQVWDNAMPDAGKIYTYHYWSSEVVGSELDGWYLASIYMSPAITDIPSYVLNILPSTWSAEADSNGLYIISVAAITHGMGSDMSLYVDLRRKTENGDFAPCSQFYVSATGTVVCYTDEKFEGKLIVRVGKAYYTTNTTHIVTIEMEQVNGLAAALGDKVNEDGGEVGDAVVTFDDVSGTAANVSSGGTLKSLFGKIKNWLGRLKALAFKDTVSNADVAANAAIEYSKLSGVAPTSHNHDDRYFTETEVNTALSGKQNTLAWDSTPTASSTKPVTSGGIKTALDNKVNLSSGELANTKVTFSDATGTRTNITSGDSTKNLFAKIKQWFAALGSLAFKSSVISSDFDSTAKCPQASNLACNTNGAINPSVRKSGTSVGHFSVALGQTVEASGGNSTALGYVSTAKGVSSTAVGNVAQANADYSTAIGIGATASDEGSTAIGHSSMSSAEGATQIGYGENTEANSLKFRSTTVVDGNGKITADSIRGVVLWSGSATLLGSMNLVLRGGYRYAIKFSNLYTAEGIASSDGQSTVLTVMYPRSCYAPDRTFTLFAATLHHEVGSTATTYEGNYELYLEGLIDINEQSLSNNSAYISGDTKSTQIVQVIELEKVV